MLVETSHLGAPAPRPSGVTLENKPIAEATLLVGTDAVTTASIIRGFDELRRWLAASLHGRTGAFAGFHHLDIQQRVLDLLEVGDEITMTAHVVRDSARQTSIEFVATFERRAVAGWRSETRVATGAGVVIYPAVLAAATIGQLAAAGEASETQPRLRLMTSSQDPTEPPAALIRS